MPSCDNLRHLSRENAGTQKLAVLFSRLKLFSFYYGHNVRRRQHRDPRDKPDQLRDLSASEKRQQSVRQVLGEPGHYSPAGGGATVGREALQKGS